MAQRYFSNTNVGDTYEGHGTHVAGIALGSAAGSTVVAPATDYNGIAPNAKLAFDDISVDGTELRLTYDLTVDLFPHPYAAGAR